MMRRKTYIKIWPETSWTRQCRLLLHILGNGSRCSPREECHLLHSPLPISAAPRRSVEVSHTGNDQAQPCFAFVIKWNCSPRWYGNIIINHIYYGSAQAATEIRAALRYALYKHRAADYPCSEKLKIYQTRQRQVRGKAYNADHCFIITGYISG